MFSLHHIRPPFHVSSRRHLCIGYPKASFQIGSTKDILYFFFLFLSSIHPLKNEVIILDNGDRVFIDQCSR